MLCDLCLACCVLLAASCLLRLGACSLVSRALSRVACCVLLTLYCFCRIPYSVFRIPYPYSSAPVAVLRLPPCCSKQLHPQVLPLSASSLVWDLLLLEGVAAIVRITIGILAVLERDLLGASLDVCLTLLTHAEDCFELRPPGAAEGGQPDDAGAAEGGEHGRGDGRVGVAAGSRECKSFAAVLEAAGICCLVEGGLGWWGQGAGGRG